MESELLIAKNKKRRRRNNEMWAHVEYVQHKKVAVNLHFSR